MNPTRTQAEATAVARLEVQGKTVELPVVVGSEGEIGDRHPEAAPADRR